MRSSRLAIATIAASLAGGCAHNAVLELTLALPGPTGETRFAVVDASAGVEPDGTREPIAFVLADGDPTALSIVADAGEQALPLFVRVRFCDDAACQGEPAPPEVLIEVQRAFYAGVRTFLSVELPAIPAARDELSIDACAVRGCIEGGADSYCVDGVHVCDL